MATQTNPFSQGLAAWAQSLDPADMARGQAMQAGIRKASLEEQILADRIRNRGLLSSNTSADPIAVAGALSNESFSPEALVNANLKGKSAATLLDPYASLSERGRAAAARGDSLTESLVNAMEGRRPAPSNVQTLTGKDGSIYAMVPDETSPIGVKPQVVIPAAPEKPKTVVIPAAGGTAYKEDPLTGELTPAIEQGPVKAFDPIAAKRERDRQDRMMMGAGFVPEEYVNKLLGSTDAAGNPTGRPGLNPFEMASVLAEADKIAKSGYSMLSAIQYSLRRHGLSQATVTEGEFEGDQSWGWWFNPAMQVEVDADKVGLPSTPEGGKFLRGRDTRFFSSIDRNNYANNVVRSNFVRGDDIVVPLSVVAKATDLGDDFGAAAAEPRFAKPTHDARGVPQTVEEGVIYYSPTPSGGATYGVGRRDKDGNLVVVPIQ